MREAEFVVSPDEDWMRAFGAYPEMVGDDYVHEVRPTIVEGVEVVISWDPVGRSVRFVYRDDAGGPLVELFSENVHRIAVHHNPGFAEVEVHVGLDGAYGVTKFRLLPTTRIINLLVRA